VKGGKGKRGYVLLPLEEEVVKAVDGAAAELGVTRTNLVRILVLSYVALLQQRQHPAVALFATAQQLAGAPAKLPAGAAVEQGEPTRGDEPQLVVKR